MMKTHTANMEEQSTIRKWYVVDATDQPLGRLASRIASIIKGKNKPLFSPHQDLGDHIIVINAEKIKLTGRKIEQKYYWNYSGYPGGMRITPAKKMMETHPERIITHAVRGMLPKNALGRKLRTKLRVFIGPEHTHQAQQPETLKF